MIAVDHILRGDPLLACADSDGHAMLVAAAYHFHLLALKAEETHIDVGRHIHPGKVPDMHRAVGIRKSCGNKSPSEVFLHNSDLSKNPQNYEKNSVTDPI